MAIEIERKFLVDNALWQNIQPDSKAVIAQGYLSLVPERTVRIRIKNEVAFLTVKGKNSGFSRMEFEYKIPLEEGKDLLQLCEGSIIKKTRYFLQIESLEWEVDVFEGDNKGLIVAEVELQSEDEKVKLPAWVKQEVSLDSRYYNANLVQHPFKDWTT